MAHSAVIFYPVKDVDESAIIQNTATSNVEHSWFLFSVIIFIK